MLLEIVNGWLKSLSRAADAGVRRRVGEALAEPVITYALPGPPPTGRHVMTPSGKVFERTTFGTGAQFGPWGAWHDVEESDRPDIDRWHISWAELLIKGPLVLLPLNEIERAQAILYGPPGARWGDPNTPCGYGLRDARSVPEKFLGMECDLGQGHIGAHKDEHGIELPILSTYQDPPAPNTTSYPNGRPPAAALPPHVVNDPCTCGHPAAHRAGCPRRHRAMGGSSEWL